MWLTTLRPVTIALMFALFAAPSCVARDNARPAYQLPVAEFETESGWFVNNSDDWYVDYLWQSFVAISWPAKLGNDGALLRGAPDTDARLPAIGSPLVWESFPLPNEVFLSSAHWADYPEWEVLPNLPAGLGRRAIEKLCNVAYEPKISHVVLYAINQPNINIEGGAVAPLLDQNRNYVRYQVTLNRSYFEYIRERQYYKANTQAEEVSNSIRAQLSGSKKAPDDGFLPLPIDAGKEPGMLETKAAWKILKPGIDIESRYYHRPALVISPDKTTCTQETAGLIALHVHRFTLFSHAATTFEQVDNVQILDPHRSGNAAGKIPSNPSLNPGEEESTLTNIWPPYGKRGFAGNLPPVITSKTVLAPRSQRQPNNISRATPIPLWLQKINQRYQEKYKDTPLAFYQMVNAQHAKSNCRFQFVEDDWSMGKKWYPASCPQPNTTRLINTALESYTQLVDPFTNLPQNYSCQGCHYNARPCGFAAQKNPLPGMRPEFHVMSFLLGKAQFPGQRVVPENYSCNNPETQFHTQPAPLYQ